MTRSTALALTFLTGFSGLVYEVAWQKYVATLLGSHSEATAAVLALFLGGLSCGYVLFGRISARLIARAAASARPVRLLVLYGAVEAGIGLFAWAFPLLFGAAQRLSFAIPHAAGGLGFALDVSIVALLVFPPAVLMGGTIPLLTQALARDVEDATRLHAFVYGFNTAGAFAGALASDFVLIPWLGLAATVWAMGTINLAAGGAFAVLGLRGQRAQPVTPAAEDPAPRLGVYAVVALLVGFAAMTLETVLIRLGGLALGSSEFTFSLVVAVFVFCIALGSFSVSALARVPKGLVVVTHLSLVALLAALYRYLQDAPYWAHVLRSVFRDGDAAFYPYHLGVFGGALAVLALPVGLSGAALPLIFDRVKRERGGLGSAAGRLYGWNTAGSLLGALLGGYVLLFWLDLHDVYWVAVAAVWLAALLLAARIYALPWLAVVAFGLVPIPATVWLAEDWEPRRLASALFRDKQPLPYSYDGPRALFDQHMRGRTFPFHADDPNSTVTVMRSPWPKGGEDLALSTNGKPDGSIRGDYPTMALLGLLPALFAEPAESAFVIGFGTGVTTGELAALDSMKSVVVAEISPGVIAAAPLFERLNQGALRNPKTHVVVSDAYRALQRSNERFDLIVSEPSNPWVTGVEMLFSREFLQAAKDRLTPSGVHAQWFHLYETDTRIVELVLRTYASVFDHMAVWQTLVGDLVLLGFNSDAHALDVARLVERAGQPDMRAGLARAGIESLPALLAQELMPLGVVHAAGFEGDLHTILHPILGHRAARAFFRGERADVPPTLRSGPAAVGASNALLRRYVADRGVALDDDEHRGIVNAMCKWRRASCATAFAAWLRDHPEASAREALLARVRPQERYREQLSPQRLALLASLFDANGSQERTTPKQASHATELFVEHYHHPEPFARGALASLWRRCRDPQPGNPCLSARQAAERRVGPL